MQTKRHFLIAPLQMSILLIGFSTSALINNNDNFNVTTTTIYAKPLNPASMTEMYLRSLEAAATASGDRTARRASLSNSCTTNDGASGTCMSRFNCMRLGGTVKGSCTTGYAGICCETNLQCGQTSKLKRTIIHNPSMITMDDCLYVIEPYSTNVCQLLVEFESFQLEQPLFTSPTGTNRGTLECIDYLEIGDFKLCGNNAQQHLYLPFNVANGVLRIPLNFHITTRQANWRLIITQLECPTPKRRMNLSFLPFITDNSLQDARTIFSTHNSDWDLLAPPGCDQYFRQSTGNIKSFNYNPSANTLYMSNLKYTICIKPTPGAATIEYTVQYFSLGIESSNDPGADLDCHGSILTDGRLEHFVMIPKSKVSIIANAQPTYFCKDILQSGDVITAESPFIMYFQSNEEAVDTQMGFSFNYRVKSVLG